MPQFEVGVIVMKDRANVLLARPKDSESKVWGLPGGYVNDNESVRDAAIRNAAVQTGLAIDPKQSLFFCEQLQPSHRVALFCLATVSDSELPPRNVMECRWADVRELAKIQQEDGIEDFSAQAFLKFSDYLRAQAAASGGRVN